MSDNNKARDYSCTTFASVVIEKNKLLDALRKNKEEHNTIYEAACSGYWVRAKEVLSEKYKEFDKAVKGMENHFNLQYSGSYNAIQEKDKSQLKGNFYISFDFNSEWPLKYPENHLEDYDRAINMLEFSVADKVELSAADFNAYVRNDWSWRKKFLSSSAGFVSMLTGNMMPTEHLYNVALSGAKGLY